MRHIQGKVWMILSRLVQKTTYDFFLNKGTSKTKSSVKQIERHTKSLLAANLIQCSSHFTALEILYIWVWCSRETSTAPQKSDPHALGQENTQDSFLRDYWNCFTWPAAGFEEEEFEMWVLSAKKGKTTARDRKRKERGGGRTKKEVPVLWHLFDRVRFAKQNIPPSLSLAYPV